MLLSLSAAATWLLVVQAGPKMLGPPEILARLAKLGGVEVVERSKAPVAVAAFASEMWPQRAQDVGFPAVETGADGRRRVVEAKLAPETLALAQSAEKAFQAEEYEEAAQIYQRGLAKDPNAFVLLMNLGDCRFKQGKFEEALALYERAIHESPNDHRLWWFRGQTLAHLGRAEQARASFAQALVLRPHYKFLLDWLRGEAGALGLRVDDSSFAPQVLVKADGAGAKVFWDGSSPHWLVYGACKAMWIADPSRRKEVTGVERPTFTTFEEKECLVSLIGVYLDGADIPRDPALDRIHGIFVDGMADGFVLYELASRIAPWITLTFSDADQEGIRNYVRKYVLVPVEAKPAAAEKEKRPREAEEPVKEMAP